MSAQPEALRLADLLEERPHDALDFLPVKAAAELRRLYAENEALRKTLAASCDEERQQMWEAGPGGGCSRALSAEFQRDALLEALRLLNIECHQLHHNFKDRHDFVDPCPVVARIKAAIKAAEGENT